jgi:hypothetical protein
MIGPGKSASRPFSRISVLLLVDDRQLVSNPVFGVGEGSATILPKSSFRHPREKYTPK